MVNITLNELKNYLKKVLYIETEPKKITELKKIPFYLQEIFTFFELKIFDKTFIIAINHSDALLLTPLKIRNFFATLENILEIEIIFVSDQITSWNRDRLIKQKVPFIVPGNQMFLPFIGIDLREYYKTPGRKSKYFSPSTQSVIIKIFVEKITENINPELIMNFSGYSRMTVSRIIDELESSGIIDVNFHGKESSIEPLYKGKRLLDTILPYLRNPKKRSIMIKEYDQRFNEYFFKSGYSALSEYTMISGPNVKTFAIGKRMFNSLVKSGFKFKEEIYQEDAEIELELWNYSPEISGNNNSGTVDKISLYKCFEKTNNERVLQALEELKRGIVW